MKAGVVACETLKTLFPLESKLRATKSECSLSRKTSRQVSRSLKKMGDSFVEAVNKTDERING